MAFKNFTATQKQIAESLLNSIPTFCNCRQKREQVLKILSFINNRFFYLKKQLMYTALDGAIYIEESDIKSILEANFPKDFFYCIPEDKKKEPIYIINYALIKTFLKNNRYDILTHNVDPFAEKITTEKDRNRGEITVTTNKITLKKPRQIDVAEEEKKAIIGDYKEHFPFLDSLIDFLAAVRFSDDRKVSFLYLRMPSNAGKSFLFNGILGEIGVAEEVYYQDLKENNASGLEPKLLRNSFCVFIDEFTTFPAVFKKHTHSIRVTPKFDLTQKVNLYAKVFLSAEQSESFTDGVDEQIVNRIIAVDLYDTAGRLTDRPLYKKSKLKYRIVIANYVYEKLQEKINYYISLGRIKADEEADRVLQKLYSKYKLKVESLELKIKSVIVSAIDMILQYKKDNDIPNELRPIANNIEAGRNGSVKIAQVKKTIELILKHTTDESFYKKAKYKLSTIERILGIEDKVIKIGKKSVRGGYLDMRKLRREILEAGGDIEVCGYKIQYANKADFIEKINKILKEQNEHNLEQECIKKYLSIFDFALRTDETETRILEVIDAEEADSVF